MLKSDSWCVIPAKAGIQKMRNSYVYILANKRNGTLYIGVTTDLIRRISEHKRDLIGGFTKKYCCHQLVYFEEHDSVEQAIVREKNMKEWKRKWKLELIEKTNPDWKDLWDDLLNSGFRLSPE